METLKSLQNRIKGSRFYHLDKANKDRLYISYGQRSRGIKTTAYFEIINDRLTPVVKVENDRHPNYWDDERAKRYKAEIERQFHEIIMDCELKRKEVPLHERLKDDIIPVHENSLKHQAQALRFCCSMKVTALFADTGTGKTKIALDLCASRLEARQISKVLIFCPVSTKKNFSNEIIKWHPQLQSICKIIGIESISSSPKAFFEALNFADNETQIIVDESHMIKTPTAKRSKRIKMCCEKASYKVVMTGTPVTENVHNLYMQFAMLSDLIIGVKNWLKFEEKYLILGGVSGDEIVGYKNIDELMGLLEPYTYQISKEEALDLPAKTCHTYTCQFSEDQNMYYYHEKEKLLKKIKDDNVHATDIFETFTRMQQIASGYYKYRRDDNPVILETNKPGLLDSADLTQPTVFFCKYIFEVEQLVQLLGKEKCALFTGKNPKERDNELAKFVAGETPYFVATMQSGGTGLNGLQDVSCQAIFYSNSFSYFQRKQSIGRIDRQGQKCEMRIIDLLTNSGIDNRIMGALSRKANLADEVKELLKDKTKLKQYVEKL